MNPVWQRLHSKRGTQALLDIYISRYQMHTCCIWESATWSRLCFRDFINCHSLSMHFIAFHCISFHVTVSHSHKHSLPPARFLLECQFSIWCQLPICGLFSSDLAVELVPSGVLRTDSRLAFMRPLVNGSNESIAFANQQQPIDTVLCLKGYINPSCFPDLKLHSTAHFYPQFG